MKTDAVHRPRNNRAAARGKGAAGRSLALLADRLAAAVAKLRFAPPVAHVYNPLVYARRPHHAYLRLYARRGVQSLLLGMNPGPWGMVQTGVPFGEVGVVREWLRICEPVDAWPAAHPKRPVLGFACARSEVSGARLWGWARARFHEPAAFFRRFFVANYCPLAFLSATGRNLTPDALPAEQVEDLLELCDRALREVVEVLRPRRVIGVGAFAARRAAVALGGAPPVGQVLHPSPASPAANRGWAAVFETQLAAMGIALE